MASISAKMRERVAGILSVGYEACLEPLAMKARIDEEILYDWIDRYKRQCERNPSALEIAIDGYTFLWDETYERIIAVYGIATTELVNGVEPREQARTAYYYRNFVSRYDEAKYDTGHFIAHSIGGRMDINLFPQKREVNRGHSAEGAVYRRMENYALKHPETLVFSRPFYFDDTWRPYFLEYGVLRESSGLWVNVFENI
jgi:hypothetical protein